MTMADALTAVPRGSRGAAAAAVLLAAVVYVPFLGLPLLPDDYLQVHLAERFLESGGWLDLLGDPLYRSRATSLVVSYLTLLVAGFSPLAFNLSGIILHMINVRLVFGLRGSPWIGRRLAAWGSLIFAVRERHHEAVIWYAALPELLVFTFSLAAMGQWIRWLKSPRPFDRRWWLAFVLFLGALASKESAVAAVPLLVFLAIPYRRKGIDWVRGLAPFFLAAAVDAVLVFSGAARNQHFSDGTFAASANFLVTLANSIARGLWVWGLLAVIALAFFPGRARRSLALVTGVWVVAAMLPYSFLTYMPRIPSRHHYLASVGFSLLIAAGLFALTRTRPRLLPVLAAMLAVHNAGYLWTSKRAQLLRRAEPIERVVAHAKASAARPIRLACFPGSSAELERALWYRLGEMVQVTHTTDGESAPDVSFCAGPERR